MLNLLKTCLKESREIVFLILILVVSHQPFEVVGGEQI